MREDRRIDNKDEGKCWVTAEDFKQLKEDLKQAGNQGSQSNADETD